MIRISTRGRYGARAVFELAKNFDNGRLTVKEIAQRSGIPMKYLEQIFFLMKEAPFITSVRGSAGGYELAVPPETLTLLEVLEKLEGPFAFVNCAKNSAACDSSRSCVFRGVWQGLSAAAEEFLSKITYADLLQKATDEDFDAMIYPGRFLRTGSDVA